MPLKRRQQCSAARLWSHLLRKESETNILDKVWKRRVLCICCCTFLFIFVSGGCKRASIVQRYPCPVAVARSTWPGVGTGTLICRICHLRYVYKPFKTSAILYWTARHACTMHVSIGGTICTNTINPLLGQHGTPATISIIMGVYVCASTIILLFGQHSTHAMLCICYAYTRRACMLCIHA